MGFRLLGFVQEAQGNKDLLKKDKKHIKRIWNTKDSNPKKQRANLPKQKNNTIQTKKKTRPKQPENTTENQKQGTLSRSQPRPSGSTGDYLPRLDHVDLAVTQCKRVDSRCWLKKTMVTNVKLYNYCICFLLCFCDVLGVFAFVPQNHGAWFVFPTPDLSFFY